MSAGSIEHLTYRIPSNAVEKVVALSREEQWCSRKVEYWAEGSKVGQRRWWKNGQVSDEQPMRNGLLHGITRWWREDGKTLVSEHPYKEGLLDGTTKGWHPNGILASEAQYKHGNKDGLEREWNDTGNLIWEMPYKNGKLHGVARYWRANAKLQIPFMKTPKRMAYWIEGTEVSRTAYLQACKTNPTLPDLRAEK